MALLVYAFLESLTRHFFDMVAFFYSFYLHQTDATLRSPQLVELFDFEAYKPLVLQLCLRVTTL